MAQRETNRRSESWTAENGWDETPLSPAPSASLSAAAVPENAVPAGAVRAANPCGMTNGGGCALATVYFPNQVYRAGFRPCEALAHGTLFPELVSEYPTCQSREV